MFVTPTTILSAAATLLAVLVVIYTFVQVGQMRGKHKIAAPAMTGHPEFERAVRVQMNTIEQFAIFLPLLWLATIYFRLYGWIPAILGLVWVAGRLVYSVGYMADAEKRHIGFLISAIANACLLLLAVIGIVVSWIAVNA